MTTHTSDPLRRFGVPLAIAVAMIAIALGIRHFLRPVDVDAEWTLELRSSIGPTDVYLGESLVGTTPFDLTLRADDPRVTTITSRSRTPVHSAKWVLELLEAKVEPLGPPDALPAGAVHGGLAGGVPMRGHPDDPSITLWWFKEVARRTDGSLEVVQPILIEDGPEEIAYAFLLRFRRGTELAPDLNATQKRSGDSKTHRTLIRRAEYRFSAILELGESHELERLAAAHGGGEWWLRRFEPGAPTLADDPTSK